MGMIINIDKALELRTDYNVLKEPLNAMMKYQQEMWEKENPIDMIYNRGSISGFQETYTSSIGFAHAMAETGDFSVGPIFNTAEGFSATYRTRQFQGGFIISQQTLEDGMQGQARAKDDASQFVTRWHGDVVEYAMKNLDAAFGRKDVVWGTADNGGVSKLRLTSADTADGDISNPVKNPLFYKSHTTVKRTDEDNVILQSNIFAPSGTSTTTPGINLVGSDPAKIVKLAELINRVITYMENSKNDNGKYAGVSGEKTIVTANDPLLNSAIDTALAMDCFHAGESMILNPAYKRAVHKSTAYLNDIDACAADSVTGVSRGFFIVDKAYNAQNHGLELTERLPFTLEVTELKRPWGIAYDGRERFDINVATWRGIAYVYIGTYGTTGTWNAADKFTELALTASIVKPVSVVGTVTTEQA